VSREHENYQWLKNCVFSQGGSLFGVVDIESLKARFLLSEKELEGLRFGISIGVILSPSILSGIEQRPTLLYKWHYRQANNLLDKMAFIVSKEILERGYHALPVPSSQIVDWENQKGHVSHRAVAEAAGLGWRGKNNLIVNARYGSQIRLVSVLTDLPLQTDHPVDFGCGDCSLCVSACPAHALGESPRAYDLAKCFDRLRTFSKIPGIGQFICGVCVKVCSGKAKERHGK